LKAVTHAARGQKMRDSEHLKIAQQYFQLVGASASECDTIPGRQCMASCFYLLHQFDDVIMFLNSIHQYFKEDADYNWNHGMALANIGNWKEVRP
jgi:intraflagellar transport protein 56